MRLSQMKRNKFDWRIYQHLIAHPDDPNYDDFMRVFEEKYGKARKKDPDLKLVAQAFVAMGKKLKSDEQKQI